MSNREQSVIDAIDALVNEQLTQEASGYDHNINQPECRCGRPWHGLPRDTCPGSAAQGPIAKYSKALVKIDPNADFADLAAFVEYVKACFTAVCEQILTVLLGPAAAAAASILALFEGFDVDIASAIAFDEACATELAGSILIGEDDTDEA